MNSISPGRTTGVKEALVQKFGDTTGWARATTALLRGNGFNCVGAWSDNASLRAVGQPVFAFFDKHLKPSRAAQMP